MRQAALALVLVLAVASLGAATMRRSASEHRETLYVFGTLVEIVIRGETEATARAATAELGQMFQAFHDDWHAWRPGALGVINSAIAEGYSARVPPQLARVLQDGRQLACESGGLFNPAIGELIALWGFHQDTRPTGAPPAGEAIARIVAAAPRMSDLWFLDDRVGARNSAVQLDLGGFAKGAALDLAGQALSARGIEHAVLNAGGDVNVIGRHGRRPWRVAIRDPFVWGAVAAVSLEPGEVLYTSGNYERYFDHDGQRFAHILDPRTGYPVQDIVSVSVLSRDGAHADAAATALSVAGRDWPRVARDMGVTAVLVIGADGRMEATPDMRDRLDPVGGRQLSQIDVVALPSGAAPNCRFEQERLSAL